MADGIIFWTKDGTAAGGGWLRVVDGHIVQRGHGSDWRAATGLDALPEGERAVRILPVPDVALHWIACPGMPVRQGAAAAPLLALEASIGPQSELHAATLPAPDADNPHIVAVTAQGAMNGWIADAMAMGVPDASLVPAGIILPAPEEGFVGGKIGDATVLRGPDCVLIAEEPLSALVVGDATVRLMDDAVVESALMAALDRPTLDLRQGRYAVRHAAMLPAGWGRRLAVLAGTLAATSLFIALVTIVRFHAEAAALDARTLTLARPLVPNAADAADAEAKLASLAAQRGADGFTGRIAGVMAAMQPKTSVTMTSLSQQADGTVHVQLAASGAGDINDVISALRTAGWTVLGNGPQQQGARAVADISLVAS